MTAGGRIQFGRPIDNLKSYLPDLLAARNANQPANRGLGEETASRQLSFGILQLVELSSGGKIAGNAGDMRIDESMVDNAVNRIISGNRASAQTYVLTVNGGVRAPADDEEGEADPSI